MRDKAAITIAPAATEPQDTPQREAWGTLGSCTAVAKAA